MEKQKHSHHYSDKPPYAERHVRWCERTVREIIPHLLLDLYLWRHNIFMEQGNSVNYASKYLPVILLLLFSIPLFFLNIHKAHSSGGDDYAQYLKEAMNIANGKPFYQSNYVFNAYNNCYSPPQYPPGFPLLLSPVMRIWPLSITAVCYFNTVIAVCLLFSFYAFFKRRMEGILALCLAVIVTYSGCMIDLKQSALSDASGLLFVMLYLIARSTETFAWKRTALLVVFATLAILIRTQAVLLLFAEVVYLCISIIRDWRNEKRFPIGMFSTSPPLYVVVATLLVLFFVNRVFFPTPSSAAGFYVSFLKITLQKGIVTIIRDNVNFLLTSISAFFYFETDNSIRTAIVTLMQNFGLVFCVLGFIISVTKRLTFDDVFFVLMCGLVLYYPIHDARYFFPAIAIVFYYCYLALAKLLPAMYAKANLRYVVITLTVVYLVAGFRYLVSTTKAPAGYVPAANDRQAFSYLSQHVNDTDIILCARPRLITLYTNKRCMIHAWQYPMETNKKVFDSLHVKYLLLVQGFVEDYYHTYLREYQHPLDSACIAPGYMLYTLR